MSKKEKTYSDIVKALPLAKSRKPSDVFSAFFDNAPLNTPFKSKNIGGTRTFLSISAPKHPSLKAAKKEMKRRRREILERIKQDWPPEKAAAVTKKQRQSYRTKFNAHEYEVFVWYVKSCRRGKNKQKRSIKGKQRRERHLQYENYINSSDWARRKNLYYQSHPRVCAACGSCQFIHLHHMVYADFGNERDDHLIPLCADHHKAYHDRFGTQRNMLRTTELFIKETRALHAELIPMAA